jgi:hypothetical protein
MEAMDRKRLEFVLARACERLTGDWLLVGGALVALWVEGRRTTEDVDLIGMEGTQEERFALMSLAAELQLPIEAVNSAADFFVRRVAGWREELEPFLRGASATIHRPTPTLFLLLKVGRLSAQDLADCLAVIRKARDEGLRLDGDRVTQAISALPSTSDSSVRVRRQQLLQALADERDPQ